MRHYIHDIVLNWEQSGNGGQQRSDDTDDWGTFDPLLVGDGDDRKNFLPSAQRQQKYDVVAMAATTRLGSCLVHPSPVLRHQLMQRPKQPKQPWSSLIFCAIELVNCLGRKATGREGGVKQKLAQRRLNMVEGNVNSYAPCLNNQKRLSAMREMDQLIAAIAQVTADQETDKVERKEVAAAKAKERKKKQAEKAAAETKEER
ncbi:hypothetical protein IV203_033240 [Nitzschia inconspicua]|uniref:Uncharacterized protein n=1 Tax=Nitzschia inconspicua TaxID=303405 RepID=A0A9K3KL32_9STRA|nr:hypothetical protein IV203_033240 [Nitzschia inconspicua]